MIKSNIQIDYLHYALMYMSQTKYETRFHVF